MKLTDTIISAIIKKGILFEARNVDTVVDIPTESIRIKGQVENQVIEKITVRIKAEHISVQVEKDSR